MFSKDRLKYLSLLTLTFAVGCAQTVTHTNTLIFGTNTQFGFSAGADAASVPSVSLGYKRQELVIMPLVANVASSRELRSGAKEYVPCSIPQSQSIDRNCLLVGERDGGIIDSYSVLASFGARFSGSGGTSPTGEGGLAQYFSTGVASQLLAGVGGASVVSIGGSAPPASSGTANAQAAAAVLSPAAAQAAILGSEGLNAAQQIGTASANRLSLVARNVHSCVTNPSKKAAFLGEVKADPTLGSDYASRLETEGATGPLGSSDVISDMGTENATKLLGIIARTACVA